MIKQFKPRAHVADSGASVSMDKSTPSGMYTVIVRNPSGEVHDKTRCDDYTDALDYWKAFKHIADKGFKP